MNRRDLLKAAVIAPFASTVLAQQTTTTTPTPFRVTKCGSCSSTPPTSTTTSDPSKVITTYTTTTTSINPSDALEYKAKLQRYFASQGMLFTDSIWNKIISS